MYSKYYRCETVEALYSNSTFLRGSFILLDCKINTEQYFIIVITKSCIHNPFRKILDQPNSISLHLQWVPVTKLGRLVKDMKIKALEHIYLFSLPIKVLTCVHLLQQEAQKCNHLIHILLCAPTIQSKASDWIVCTFGFLAVTRNSYMKRLFFSQVIDCDSSGMHSA